MAAIDERIRAAVTERIEASPTGDFLSVWTNFNPHRYIAPGTPPNDGLWNEPGGGFTRNTNCWAKDLDWSGVGSYRQDGQGGRWGCCAAVSPRHVITAAHAGAPSSNEINFILHDNSVYTATIVGTEDLPGVWPMDIRVWYLDEDLPNTIRWYNVLPLDWDNLLAYNSDDLGLVPEPSTTNSLTAKALIYTNQDREAHAAIVLNHLPFPKVLSATNCTGQTPDWAPYYESPVAGDSSSPMFLVVDGRMFLMGSVMSSFILATKINDPDEITAINTAMATLDAAGDNTGYTSLTHGDLAVGDVTSCFFFYPRKNIPHFIAKGSNMSEIISPEEPTIVVGEVSNFAVSFDDVLDKGELITGTPVVTEVTSSDLTFTDQRSNSSAFTMDEHRYETGKVALFKVYGQIVANTPYTLKVQITTDATPAQTKIRGVTFSVEDIT